MGSIKATFSAVDVYASNCSNDYVAMINTANEILSRIEKLHTDVQEDYEKISKQIVRLQMMREEVAAKVKSYEHKMNEAAAEAERWQAEIDYLYSHPDTVTSTDEDGNETTEEVYDYAAISAAERKRDDAMEIYYLYREKYEASFAVLVETESTQSRFETIKNAIHAVSESIQSDIYEIKKYISAIGDEAEHNTRSLQGVLGSLSTYLASKAMFMPAGTIYEDFASSGGGNATYMSSSDKSSAFSFFGKKKEETSTSSNVSSANIKEIHGIKASVFREDRVETMNTAFDNAPNWIIEQIRSVGDKTRVKEKKKTDAYYSPSRREIVMTKEYNNEDYQEVFKHEFGHYVDHSNGWLSEQTEFRKAFDDTCKRLDLSDFKGADNSMKILTEVRKSDIAKFDHHFQDIFSSIYVNDYLVENTFRSEGCEFYHHENDYWATDHNRENEIFADLFAIYSSGDRETISFVERNFSELSTTFKKLLGA